jgi:ribosome biogenesis GTPase
LAELGWDGTWDAQWEATLAEADQPGTYPARVARVDRGMCTVLGPTSARVDTHQAVAVGDWVVVGPGPQQGDRAEVRTVLPRRSAFVRKHAGSPTAEQVVAANADTVWLVNGLDAQLDVRGLERYLTLGWQSGAQPVVVLTKADVCDPGVLVEVRAQVASVAIDVAVHVISVQTGLGIDALVASHLSGGRTVALLGPSGAGKSSLVNRLAGRQVMATGAVGGNAQGRHTTTHRELIVLPSGGLLIDTPGMRELALWDADQGLAQTFADIEALAAQCRFSDCAHRLEPGCQVLVALADGSLDQSRFARWVELRHELEELAHRQNDRAAQLQRRRDQGGKPPLPSREP